MLDLKIDCLRLNIENVAGHIHRIRPITARAATIFTQRLNERWSDSRWASDSGGIDSFNVPPVHLNLNGMSNEQAAEAIASAWIEALALKLKL